jgi:Ca2+-binding EF-hand superfamily protein
MMRSLDVSPHPLSLAPQEVAVVFESHRVLVTSAPLPPPPRTETTRANRALDSNADPAPAQVSDPEAPAVSYRFLGASRQRPPSSTALLPLLPSRDYYRSHPLPSKEEVRRQFRRLDLSGEGRLTYLTLKSALELLLEDADPTHYGRGVDDVLIRSWLRENDQGAKGFVDWEDFVRIFASDQETPPAPQYRYQPASSASAMKKEAKEKGLVDNNRIARIKRTFQKYDLNGDGLIDVDDLTKVFRASGRNVERDEIRDWVRERDSKGIGAVCFEDFLAHYA